MIDALIIITIAALLGAGVAAFQNRRDRHLKETADATRRAFTRGTVHGLNLGWIHHGRAMAEIRGEELHGFGTECKGCNRIYGIVAEVTEEYWTCSSCGHRNPAPLVAEDPAILVKSNIRKS